MQCPSCGFSVRERDNFCSNCGVRLSRGQSGGESVTRPCKACGTFLPPGSNFCGFCGVADPHSAPIAAMAPPDAHSTLDDTAPTREMQAVSPESSQSFGPKRPIGLAKAPPDRGTKPLPERPAKPPADRATKISPERPTKVSGDRTPKPTTPAMVDRASQPTLPDLSEQLAEIQFLRNQGLHEDARRAVIELEEEFPGHPAIAQAMANDPMRLMAVSGRPLIEETQPSRPGSTVRPDFSLGDLDDDEIDAVLGDFGPDDPA